MARATVSVMSWVRYLIVVLFHALPLGVLAAGYPWLGLACALLVALPYIKQAKLATQAADLMQWRARHESQLHERHGAEQIPRMLQPGALDQEIASMRAARRRWRWLSLLPLDPPHA